MKVALGTFACKGVEAHLGSDLPTGVRAALTDYVRRIESGPAPLGLPSFAEQGSDSSSAVFLDLPVDAHTLAILEREAASQGATVSQLAAHSVLLYLAELDRLTPPGSTRAA